MYFLLRSIRFADLVFSVLKKVFKLISNNCATLVCLSLDKNLNISSSLITSQIVDIFSFVKKLLIDI